MKSILCNVIIGGLVIFILGIGAYIALRYKSNNFRTVHKEHKEIMERQEVILNAINVVYEKECENGKKLDILLNIATNRVDCM
jgi:hypothetical protein